jgi:hypothetical protein
MPIEVTKIKLINPRNYVVSENELLKTIDSGVNRVAQINLLGGNRNAQLRGLLNFD